MDAGREEEVFVDPFFSEDGPFCSRGEASWHAEEDYLNYKGSKDLLYDFGSSGGGNVQPLEAGEGDAEIPKTSVGNEPVAEIVFTVTSAPQGNDHKILFSAYLSRIPSDFNYFAETDVVAAPSVVDSSSMDLSGLDYLYQKVLQSRTSSTTEFLVMAGMGSALVTLPASENFCRFLLPFLLYLLL